MGAMTNFAENKVTDAIWRGQALGVPATWYFALFTSDPTETGAAGTEVTGGSYARAPLAASLTNFAGTQGAGTTVASSGTGSTTSNNVAINFPTPTANWPGPITHVGVFDAITGGNCWYFGALAASKTVNLGDPAPTIPIAAFTSDCDAP